MANKIKIPKGWRKLKKHELITARSRVFNIRQDSRDSSNIKVWCRSLFTAKDKEVPGNIPANTYICKKK